MLSDLFHPVVARWFQDRFGEPTDAQRIGWPAIAAGQHTLIAAPTGSGKTLAAFLVCIDQLVRQSLAGGLPDGIQVVYVSPLKALSNDIEKNLRAPLAEISAAAVAAGGIAPPIRVAVRTGDTPPSERQAMLRKPPHILVTTPESLYLLLTSERPREPLKSVHTMIVDEIHAVARDKRGSHLTITLERLAALADHRPRRIGLSATQRPLDQIARFLVGSNCQRVTTLEESFPDPPAVRGDHFSAAGVSDQPPARDQVAVVNCGHARALDLSVAVPPSELEAVCSNEQWAEIYGAMTELIRTHRSTLIFVNTRRLAERVTLRLSEMLGEEAVASHHGSLSRDLRLTAERRLKAGELKALVATASLEMGIDIGYIDLVCQVGSPRSIATLLQRVGRSGHHLGALPKGRLFPLTRDELLECLALVRAVKQGRLDAVEIPQAPLDILAQQIVAAVACEDWREDELFEFMRRAWPFRDLSRQRYGEIVTLLADGMSPLSRRGAYLHRDQLNGRLRARRNARLTAITSGGAIPESAEYRVLAEPQQTFVGTLDEDFAIESMAGDIFVLGNTSWQIVQVRAGEVLVRDAQGAPPTVPFWFGEAPGRTIELSREVSRLRQQIAEGLSAASGDASSAVAAISNSVRDECGVGQSGAEQAVQYVSAQREALGVVPTCEEIVFERFFDESGGMQLVIHSPFGARVNRAWGLALRKRFCRSFDFELQAAATDNGILLSIGPQHSFPIEALFKMLGLRNARDLLEQAVLAAPMFQVRWRWNLTRALAVLRTQAGKKVPPPLQRFRADDLLAAAFPETVGCLENHHGDVKIPDHPLVQQTMHDCLHEAMDLDRWLQVLGDVEQGRIHLRARETREPSPFSYELLNANPYAFLDDAPLEERRARAVQTRRGLASDETRELGRLDPDVIDQVCREAWPLVRDADELHDALRLVGLVPVDRQPEWCGWFQRLVADGRATTVVCGGHTWWVAAESWPQVRALHPAAASDPALSLPERLDRTVERSEALLEFVRGQIQCSGPIEAAHLASALGVDPGEIEPVLEQLEGEGVVLRGRFRPPAADTADELPLEWCDRRLLARIHRLTVEGLRRQIRPVAARRYLSFLAAKHRLAGPTKWQGREGLSEVVGMLQGFDVPLGAWEPVLEQRVADFDRQQLDYQFLAGEFSWGRLRHPAQADGGRAPRVTLTRATPVSLLLRADLAALCPPDEIERSAGTSAAQDLYRILVERGALFHQELVASSGLLPSQAEEALRELAALGLVTADTFEAARSLARIGVRNRTRAAPPPGRWSCFPGNLQESKGLPERIERWCHLLLTRYGIVFRDLLARESAAPPWGDLARAYRRLELRGEVRGGRFVDGVGGEQFAREADVQLLRRHGDEEEAESGWTLIPAADPLNLAGIVGGGTRVPAIHKNLVAVQAGRWIAARISGVVEFFDGAPLAADQRDAVATALRRGGRSITSDPLARSRRRAAAAERRGLARSPVMRPR